MDGEKGNTVTDKLKEMIQQNPDGSFYVGMELIKILISRVCDYSLIIYLENSYILLVL